MEQSTSLEETKPYSQLKGRELVEWALDVGQEACLEQLPFDSPQRRYFQAVARRAGVEFPPEFFESSVEELMDRR